MRHLVVSGAWWDVVDDIATHVVRDLLLGWPEPIATVLRAWSRDDHLWIRRVAMLAQVGAGARTDPVLLADVLTPNICLLYTSPSPRDRTRSRMPSSA